MNNLVIATEEIKKVIQGKDDIIKNVMMAILSGGHILLEDVPGVGKTTLALAFSRVLGLDYKRVQFTPDVMPSDVTGFSMYNKKTNEFEYIPGAALCNLLLADEINRTSPKTQAALLEVMEEGRVTVDGVTRQIPKPFTVIATQNPFGSAGTQRLPQSQMDRFLIRLSMGYPDKESEIMILKGSGIANIDCVNAVLDKESLEQMQRECSEVFVKDEIYSFVVDIANATRTSELFEIGISPRGSIALIKMAKANAYMEGRDYTVPEDVLDILNFASAHRTELSEKAKAMGYQPEEALSEAIKDAKVKVHKR